MQGQAGQSYMVSGGREDRGVGGGGGGEAVNIDYRVRLRALDGSTINGHFSLIASGLICSWRETAVGFFFK